MNGYALGREELELLCGFATRCDQSVARRAFSRRIHLLRTRGRVRLVAVVGIEKAPRLKPVEPDIPDTCKNPA